jgi:hypothetical protein
LIPIHTAFFFLVSYLLYCNGLVANFRIQKETVHYKTNNLKPKSECITDPYLLPECLTTMTYYVFIDEALPVLL